MTNYNQPNYDPRVIAQLQELVAQNQGVLYRSFAELGRAYYKETAENPNPAYAEMYKAIEANQEKVNQFKAQLAKAKGCILCPSCGFELPMESAFCNKCGYKIPAQKEEEIVPERKGAFCSGCGKQLVPGAKFCVGCGTRLDDEEQNKTDEAVAVSGGNVTATVVGAAVAGAGAMSNVISEAIPQNLPVSSVAPVVEAVSEEVVAPVVEAVPEEVVAPVAEAVPEEVVAPVVEAVPEEVVAPVVEAVSEEVVAPVVETVAVPAPSVEEVGAYVPVVSDATSPQEAVKLCANCNQAVPADYAFCIHCGSPMAVATEEPVEEIVSSVPVCPGCGAEIFEDSSFCVQCGMRLKPMEEPQPEPQEDRCPNCNAVIEEDSMFCINCGTKVR